MNKDCVTVDGLVLEIADYQNNYQEVTVEKLERLFFQSCEVFDLPATACIICGFATVHEERAPHVAEHSDELTRVFLGI